MREEISERLLSFAASIVLHCKELNKSFEGKHVFHQLFRSATSVGANFEESHSAQSSRDFIHKREIALKELRESLYWLKLIERTDLLNNNNGNLQILVDENEQ